MHAILNIAKDCATVCLFLLYSAVRVRGNEQVPKFTDSHVEQQLLFV